MSGTKDYLAILKQAALLARARDPKVAATLEKHVEIIERCPPDRRAAVAGALRILQPKYVALPGAESVESAVVSYPKATREQKARLLLGESPVTISGGLTKAEAHQWLSEDPREEPARWLLDKAYRGGGTWSSTHWAYNDDMTVARWVVRMLSIPARRQALIRERTWVGPAGREITGSFITRVDELKPQDLREGVDETFERAARRSQKNIEKLLAKRGEPLATRPQWWKPVKCATVLLSAAELVAEGKIMEHCVATYVGAVKEGESVIVRLEVPELKPGMKEPVKHRSTVEIDRRTGRVKQHRTHQNKDPHPINKKALRVLLKKWGLPPNGNGHH